MLDKDFVTAGKSPLPTPLDLRPIKMADPRMPADPGPYFVGYGDDWREFDTWDEAWLHHVMRGSTVGSSHIKVAA